MADDPTMSGDVEPATSLEPVSVEHNGIVLSGVGVSEDALRETMESRTPPESEPAASGADAPASEASSEPSTHTRDEGGRFAKPTRGQKRFDQLTREREKEKTAREAAEARATSAEQRIADYEKRLAALEQRRGVTEPESPPAAEPNAAQPRKLAEFVSLIGQQYQSYEDAIEAYHEYRDGLRSQDYDARIRTSIEADRASRALQSHVEQLFDEGRRAFPDFDTVVGGSKVHVPDAIRHRIWNAPNAAAIMYALAKDEALLTRIAGITDPYELGMTLAGVVSPKPVASPASTVSAVSSAPTPYQPVGSGSKTTAPTLGDLAVSGGDDYDSSGYRERRAQERRAGRR